VLGGAAAAPRAPSRRGSHAAIDPLSLSAIGGPRGDVSLSPNKVLTSTTVVLE
jgi:hypothetical protein